MRPIDDAAACAAVYNYVSPCPKEDAKERICQLVCCCNNLPLVKNIRALKQLCVDKLMEKSSLPSEGILPAVPYDMDRDPPVAIRDPRDFPGIPVAARLIDLLTGEYRKGRIRIPDVTVLKDPTGSITQANTDKLYEIKFPGDRWGKAKNGVESQQDAYARIAGDPENLKELNVDQCGCKDRPDPESLPVPDEVKQAAINQVYHSLSDLAWNPEVREEMAQAGLAEEYRQLQNAIASQDAIESDWGTSLLLGVIGWTAAAAAPTVAGALGSLAPAEAAGAAAAAGRLAPALP